MRDEVAESSWASPRKGKLKRQIAILDAVRAIISESGAVGLKMREVAIRAEVSLATPYNLFGSKAGILEALYEEEHVAFVRYFEVAASDEPLTRLFQVIDFTLAFYARSPEYYLPVIGLLDQTDSEGVARAWRSQVEFFENLLAVAVTAGDLRVGAPIKLLSSLFTRIIKSVALEWMSGRTTIEAAHYEAVAGLAILLGSEISRNSEKKLAIAKDQSAVRIWPQ